MVDSQFRDHALKHRGDNFIEREGQQQMLRATFHAIRNSVKELIQKQMDALARKFAATHDIKVKEEIERWLGSKGSSRNRGCSWGSEARLPNLTCERNHIDVDIRYVD